MEDASPSDTEVETKTIDDTIEILPNTCLKGRGQRPGLRCSALRRDPDDLVDAADSDDPDDPDDLRSEYLALVRRWIRHFLQGQEGCASFMSKRFGLPIFVDGSRSSFLRRLLPSLVQLDEGILSGQGCCLLMLGTRGTGKSTFLKSIIQVFVEHASANSFAVYMNLKTSASMLPSAVISKALGIKLDDDSPVDHMSQLIQKLARSGRRIFLVVDELEKLYCHRDGAFFDRFYSELHAIGELSGRRPILSVLTGSAAVLRALAFKLPHCLSAVSMEYPNVVHASSLNNRKHQDHYIRPVQDVRDMRVMLQCLLSSSKHELVALRDKFQQYGEELVGVDPAKDLVEQGFEFNEEACYEALWLTRGLPAWFETIAEEGAGGRAPQVNRIFKTTFRTSVMRVLFNDWKSHQLGNRVNIVDAARNDLIESVARAPAVSLDAAGLDIPNAYQLMDDGVLFFDEQAQTVQFLNPADVVACLLKFETNSTDGSSRPLRSFR